MPNIPKEKDIEHIFANEQECINFLFESEALYKYDLCPKCKDGEMKIYPSKPKVWKCNNYKCLTKISIYSESFFAGTKLKCNDVIRVCYKWLAGQKFLDIQEQTGHSSATITYLIKCCRELVASNIEEQSTIIGGNNIIVEVDESKFGKVKYGRGHRVEGVWVVGGVERTPERRMFLISVPDRTRETLMSILGDHIAEGSIVHSDFWKGYLNMEDYLDVQHRTVNHSKNFKDPVSGVHTNTIEGNWYGIKSKIAPRNRTSDLIDLHLLESLWRRQNQGNIWKQFIECLATTKYIKNGTI